MNIFNKSSTPNNSPNKDISTSLTYVEGKNAILFAKHFWKAYLYLLSEYLTLYAAFEYLDKNNSQNKNNGGQNSGKRIKITPQ